MTTVFTGTGKDARKIVDDLRSKDYHVSIFVTMRDGRRTGVKLKVPDLVANSARSHIRGLMRHNNGHSLNGRWRP